MRLDCPHCHNAIEIVEQPEEVVCPSCGSSIQLDPGRTRSFISGAKPRRVARFELLEELGVGAFGTVYKARDTELDRTVAIKLPRAGNLATTEDVDRFFREARSAAQLQHPRIVSVYDAGQTEDTCWLVSEYIQGETLSDRLQRHQFNFRDAAQLAAEVADAVEFAHAKGVVHRDLKPSNIMLDMESRPHVMDFGLAKRESGEITMTVDGQILGTPAYMSPEQAKGEAHLVDGRSDVYSLGVILYELLTGEIPFRGNKRMLMMQVLQDDPRPPRRLNDHIPRDLETITLRCMSKEPARRYATASALAQDLRRWLQDEPIHARPIGNTQRLWRWARRNPRVAGLGAAVLLLLFTIAVGSSIVAALLNAANVRERQALVRVQRQKERADDNVTLAQQAVVRERQALVDMQQQKERANDNFRLARDAVDRYYLQVSDSDELKAHGLEQLRQRLLKTAVEFYHKFVDQESDEPQVQFAQATAYKYLAAITADIDSKTTAIEQFRKGIAINERLAETRPDDVDFQLEIATGYNNIGQLFYELGRLENAEIELLKGLEIRKQIVQNRPDAQHGRNDLAASYNVLGLTYRAMSRSSDAEKSFAEALKLREQLAAQRADDARYQSDLAKVLNNFANFYRAMGNSARAREMLAKDLAIMEKLVEAHPTDPTYQLELSSSCNNLANILRVSGKVADAEALHKRALALRKQLVRTHPSVTLYQSEYALSFYNLGNLYRRSQRMSEAENAYAEALTIRERLAEEYPEVASFRRALGQSYNSLAIMYRATGRFEEAEQAYAKALTVREQLASEQPDSAAYLQELAAVHGNRGNLLSDMKRPADAEQAYERALAIKQQLVERHPNVPSFQRDLADAHYNMAIFFREQRRHVTAEQAFQRSIAAFESLVSASPKSLSARQGLAQARTMLAVQYQTTGRADEARSIYERTLAEQEALLRDNAGVASLKLDVADTLCMLGHLQRDARSFANAIPWYERSLSSLEVFLEKKSVSARVKLAARRALRGKAYCLAQLDRHDDALPTWNRALEFAEGRTRDWDELQLARSLFHSARHDQALTRVEGVVERSGSEGLMLFEAARVLATASGLVRQSNLPDERKAKLGASYAARSVELLRQAKEGGYFDAKAQQQALQTDQAFLPLHDREDFQAILDKP